MANLKIDLTQVEDNQLTQIEPGRYHLKIEEVDLATASTGTLQLVINYEIIGQNRKLRYDNMSLKRADGSLINFGILKAKKVGEVTGVLEPEASELDVNFLKAMLPGKELEADVVINDRGYPEIKGLNYYPAVAKEETTEEAIEFDFDI